MEPKKIKKWALVSWDTLCFPKVKNRLGIRDLGTLSIVLGEKI